MHEQVTIWATLLWQGFSLALVISILARAAVAIEQKRELGLIRLSLAHRLFIGGFCFIGLFAAALTGGTPTAHMGSAFVGLLIGAASGIWMAIRLIKKVG
jgi:hypothetical protein